MVMVKTAVLWRAAQLLKKIVFLKFKGETDDVQETNHMEIDRIRNNAVFYGAISRCQSGW